MNPSSLILVGANRGGSAVTSEAARKGLLPSLQHVELVDPEPGRADRLGGSYRAAGARVRTFARPVEDVLDRLDPDAPTVLSVDNPGSAATAARDRAARAPTLMQLVSQPKTDGRQRGATLAITSLLDPARPQERQAAQKLLDRFAEISPSRRSSALVRAQPLAELSLQHSRQEAARATVSQLLDLDWARQQSQLTSLIWRGQPWPVTVDHTGDLEVSHHRQQAFDVAAPGMAVAVALLRPDGGVTVVMVERSRSGRLHARAWFHYHPPAPEPPPVARPSRVTSTPRLSSTSFFTD
mgnify:CR=1 FL=1